MCDTLNGGIELGCLNNHGGILRMWIAEWDSVDWESLGLSSPGDEINAIPMLGSPPASFFEYQFKRNTSFYTENETYSEENGRTIFDQAVNLVLNRREKTKRDNFVMLRGKKLAIIIEDNNEINWLFGQKRGMRYMTNNGGSGTQTTDPNQYVITFSGQEPDAANTVTDAAIAAVI